MQVQLLDQLTEKQCEALELVWERLTSKEIARELEVSPRSVDQRLDAARRTLGARDRHEAARLYMKAKGVSRELTSESFTVTPAQQNRPSNPGVEKGMLRFNDALPIREVAPWESSGLFGAPELKPSSLGPSARMALIVLGMLGISLTAGAIASLYLVIEKLVSH